MNAERVVLGRAAARADGRRTLDAPAASGMRTFERMDLAGSFMKARNAAILAILLPGLAYALVATASDRLFWGAAIPPGRALRAALVLRDDVTPFQKWGSRQFTQPYLDRYYDAAWYFTQSDRADHKQEFLSSLRNALERYPQVDLILLAHTNRFVEWVAELPPQARGQLRLIYNTGCRDLRQGPIWLDLGAKGYIGHPGLSTSPVFYFYFLRRWTRGATAESAMEESNARMRTVLRRLEPLTLGLLDAERAHRESEAYCYGEKPLRFTGNGI